MHWTVQEYNFGGICFLQANLELGAIHTIHILEQVQFLHLNCNTYNIKLLKSENVLATGNFLFFFIDISNSNFGPSICDFWVGIL